MIRAPFGIPCFAGLISDLGKRCFDKDNNHQFSLNLTNRSLA